MWNPEQTEAGTFLVNQAIKWVPKENKPANIVPWFEALEDAGLLLGCRAVLTWEVDVWRVTSARSTLRPSPSGGFGKPVDVRRELIEALQARQLPVKT